MTPLSHMQRPRFHTCDEIKLCVDRREIIFLFGSEPDFFFFPFYKISALAKYSLAKSALEGAATQHALPFKKVNAGHQIRRLTLSMFHFSLLRVSQTGALGALRKRGLHKGSTPSLRGTNNVLVVISLHRSRTRVCPIKGGEAY